VEEKQMKFGKHMVPAWLVVVILILVIGVAALAYDFSTSFTMTLNVKEPIVIINHPSQFSLFPGETANFNVTVMNYSSINYSVILDFKLNDTAYQTSYVSFSDQVYNVTPGQHDLQAWMSVATNAPAETVTVSVDLLRLPQNNNLLVNGDFENGAFNGWSVTGVCTISTTTVHSGSYSAYISDQTFDNSIQQNLTLPGNEDYHLEAWVYPLKVGNLGEVVYPVSYICLDFLNRSSMTYLNVRYTWSWYEASANVSQGVAFLLNFNAFQWNLLSRDVSQDARSYFKNVNFSNLVLSDIRCVYHYSSASPGAFYVDDIVLSRT
jgi:hypothetical protein